MDECLQSKSTSSNASTERCLESIQKRVAINLILAI